MNKNHGGCRVWDETLKDMFKCVWESCRQTAPLVFARYFGQKTTAFAIAALKQSVFRGNVGGSRLNVSCVMTNMTGNTIMCTDTQ